MRWSMQQGQIKLPRGVTVRDPLGNRYVIERLLGEGSDPGTVAASIVLAAIGHGSRDNCTAIVAKYLPDE